MTQNNIFTRWKQELSSENSEEAERALIEIIIVIEEMNSKGIEETSYEILLNRDFCHFFCNLLSLNGLRKTPLINKILCYFSESSHFYKNDFFRVLKLYLRLLNSIADSNNINYSNFGIINDIFKCLSLLIVR